MTIFSKSYFVLVMFRTAVDLILFALLFLFVSSLNSLVFGKLSCFVSIYVKGTEWHEETMPVSATFFEKDIIFGDIDVSDFSGILSLVSITSNFMTLHWFIFGVASNFIIMSPSRSIAPSQEWRGSCCARTFLVSDISKFKVLISVMQCIWIDSPSAKESVCI